MIRSGPDAERPALEEQTIVITGASSGIGLATARMAADRGARVVAAARSEDALVELVEEIEAGGGDAEYVVADVAEREDVREIGAVAEDAYGGVDTWVNGAAVSIYGRLDEVPVSEMRRQFDINVWGLLYGSLEAAEHMKEQGGGAIINIGSVVSERAMLLQGSYSASKHAVKAFTDALRMELEEEGAPVAVTLVEPSAIDTPYPDHAKNYMDEEASLPPPVYAPETVARAILAAAEEPQREVTVGWGGKGMALLGQFAPGLMDRIMETVFAPQQRRDEPADAGGDGLEGPSGNLEERGDYEGHVAESSLYTRIRQRGRSPGAAALGAGAVVAYAGYRLLRRGRP